MTQSVIALLGSIIWDSESSLTLLLKALSHMLLLYCQSIFFNFCSMGNSQRFTRNDSECHILSWIHIVMVQLCQFGILSVLNGRKKNELSCEVRLSHLRTR